MRAVYLSGPTVYLRALDERDAQAAAAWFDSPFPINASRAAEFLRDEHQDPWDRKRRHLALVRHEGDEVIGGVRVGVEARAARVAFHIAPWAPDADDLQAEALRLLVPWLRHELECLIVDAEIPADQPATIRAAEDAGMRLSVRLREQVARTGHRVDFLIYQAFDPALESDHA